MQAQTLSYQELSQDVQRKIISDRARHRENPHRYRDEWVRRRRERKSDEATLWRPAYVRDIEKILHCPVYNRYADKTQVFSFYRNDDITRRGLHVQLVSRIARNIGALLGLNLDLIEAIALGHDIGHTPFGHAGERFLSELLQEHTGRYFNHNVHSVRVLDHLFARNLSLQTLDGILCHNGEFEQEAYKPADAIGFAEFDERVERCYADQDIIPRLIPFTMEGCVVRICDIIAYVGKDRQDAMKAKLLCDASAFTKGSIGGENAEIINNLVVNLVENSYGKDSLSMNPEVFEALKTAKRENYRLIYQNEDINRRYEESIRPMFHALYGQLLKDARSRREDSVLFQHHISFIEAGRAHYEPQERYREEEPNQIVVDYIASMTDDYFIDLYHHLFPHGKHKIEYIPYFKE